MRLIIQFLQVGRHIGMYELLNDCLSGNFESFIHLFLEFV